MATQLAGLLAQENTQKSFNQTRFKLRKRKRRRWKSSEHFEQTNRKTGSEMRMVASGAWRASRGAAVVLLAPLIIIICLVHIQNGGQAASLGRLDQQLTSPSPRIMLVARVAGESRPEMINEHSAGAQRRVVRIEWPDGSRRADQHHDDDNNSNERDKHHSGDISPVASLASSEMITSDYTVVNETETETRRARKRRNLQREDRGAGATVTTNGNDGGHIQADRPARNNSNNNNNNSSLSTATSTTNSTTTTLSKQQQRMLQEQAVQNRLMELKQKYMTNRAISDRAYYILLVIYSLFIIVGTVSNSLICLTVILKPQILSPRNIFIVNLAGSDLLLCVFTMPFSFIEISMKMWHMGAIPCKLVAGLQATSIFVSTISITAIALDRYKVIVYPTHQEAVNGTRSAALLLASVWIGALLLSSPLFRFRTVEHMDLPHKYSTIDSIDFCVEAWPFPHGRGIYSVISMIFQYVLPITIVSVVYAKISDKLQKRLIRRQRLTQLQCQQKRQLNLIRRTHTMLISVSLIFGLSWLPLNLLNVIGDFTNLFKADDDQLFRIVFAICHLIGCSSACSNPILYGYLNENFRKEFHQVYTHYAHRIMRQLRRFMHNCLPKCCYCCCLEGKQSSYMASTPTSSTLTSNQDDDDDDDDDMDDEEDDDEEWEEDEDEDEEGEDDIDRSSASASGSSGSKSRVKSSSQRLARKTVAKIELVGGGRKRGDGDNSSSLLEDDYLIGKRLSDCSGMVNQLQVLGAGSQSANSTSVQRQQRPQSPQGRKNSFQQALANSQQTLDKTMRFCLCISGSSSIQSIGPKDTNPAANNQTNNTTTAATITTAPATTNHRQAGEESKRAGSIPLRRLNCPNEAAATTLEADRKLNSGDELESAADPKPAPPTGGPEEPEAKEGSRKKQRSRGRRRKRKRRRTSRKKIRDATQVQVRRGLEWPCECQCHQQRRRSTLVDLARTILRKGSTQSNSGAPQQQQQQNRAKSRNGQMGPNSTNQAASNNNNNDNVDDYQDLAPPTTARASRHEDHQIGQVNLNKATTATTTTNSNDECGPTTLDRSGAISNAEGAAFDSHGGRRVWLRLFPARRFLPVLLGGTPPGPEHQSSSAAVARLKGQSHQAAAPGVDQSNGRKSSLANHCPNCKHGSWRRGRRKRDSDPNAASATAEKRKRSKKPASLARLKSSSAMTTSSAAAAAAKRQDNQAANNPAIVGLAMNTLALATGHGQVMRSTSAGSNSGAPGSPAGSAAQPSSDGAGKSGEKSLLKMRMSNQDDNDDDDDDMNAIGAPGTYCLSVETARQRAGSEYSLSQHELSTSVVVFNADIDIENEAEADLSSGQHDGQVNQEVEEEVAAHEPSNITSRRLEHNETDDIDQAETTTSTFQHLPAKEKAVNLGEGMQISGQWSSCCGSSNLSQCPDEIGAQNGEQIAVIENRTSSTADGLETTTGPTKYALDVGANQSSSSSSSSTSSSSPPPPQPAPKDCILTNSGTEIEMSPTINAEYPAKCDHTNTAFKDLNPLKSNSHQIGAQTNHLSSSSQRITCSDSSVGSTTTTSTGSSSSDGVSDTTASGFTCTCSRSTSSSCMESRESQGSLANYSHYYCESHRGIAGPNAGLFGCGGATVRGVASSRQPNNNRQRQVPARRTTVGHRPQLSKEIELVASAKLAKTLATTCGGISVATTGSAATNTIAANTNSAVASANVSSCMSAPASVGTAGTPLLSSLCSSQMSLADQDNSQMGGSESRSKLGARTTIEGVKSPRQVNGFGPSASLEEHTSKSKIMQQEIASSMLFNDSHK